jgi:hypothetical protein
MSIAIKMQIREKTNIYEDVDWWKVMLFAEQNQKNNSKTINNHKIVIS